MVSDGSKKQLAPYGIWNPLEESMAAESIQHAMASGGRVQLYKKAP